MILTISGVPGSGKTSVGKILAERLGYPFYSMGNLRGKMALERGMTITQLNALGEQESFTDTTVDDEQKRLGQTEDSFVIEGRLSWYFIPHSFKILLLCDAKEAARRIFEDQKSKGKGRQDEPPYHSIADAEKQLAARVASDHLRYAKHYQIKNYLDPKHYDLVLDTTPSQKPEETAEKIMRTISPFLSREASS